MTQLLEGEYDGRDGTVEAVTTTTYPLGCRICRAEWTQEFEFISATRLILGADGSERLDLPGYCPTGHTADEIDRSWRSKL